MVTAMNSLVIPALVLVSFRVSPGALAPESAESILAAHRATLGSEKSLAAIGVLRRRGRVSFRGFPTVGSFTEIYDPAGGGRQDALFEGIPPSVRCTNGELYWMSGTGGLEIKSGYAAAADARLVSLARHGDWRTVYAKAEVAGGATIDGRACHELTLAPKPPEALGIEPVPGEEPPAPDTFWIDAETKELVRVAVYATVSGAGWQRLVVDYSDWRTVAGVRFSFAHRMSFGPADHELVIEFVVESLETNVALDADPFQPNDAVFAELARRQSGAATSDPGFKAERREASLTASVRVVCAREKLRETLATLLPEVMLTVQRERLTPTGAPFARYHAFGDEIDVEAGIPVAETFAPRGRVAPSSLPGGDVVSGFHVGPYQDLSKTHDALARFLEKAGLSPDGGPWEIYWTDPGLERDPSKWRTEIVQPWVAGAAGGSGASEEPKGVPAAAADPAGAGVPEDMKPFDILVGTWDVSGGPGAPNGRVRFEWLAGGHFLVQHVDLVEGERRILCLEVIGHERRFGAASSSPEITSRCYDDQGNTIEFTWELRDRELTIWGGARGSAMAYRGRFSDDGNTLKGGWTWPGGGFETVSTRVERGGARQE